MITFEAGTHIAAEPAAVWDTLVQTDRWPDWDPALDHVAGTLGPGGRVTIHVVDRARALELRVIEWEPGHRLVLRGGLPLGLFTGTRTYDLSTTEAGTSVTMVETYTGPMAPMIGTRLPDLRPNFEAFVSGWRQAAEARPRAR